MIYILIGICGFLVAYAFDWASLGNLRVMKQLIGLLAICLLVYATIMVCVIPVKLHLPFFTLPFGVGLLVFSLCLLVYSMFIEIPFHNTYAENGVSNKLITTGTYALVRHPGVIWLALVYLSLALLFPSTTLFLAVIVWLIMDIIIVTLQDKLSFPKMFPAYRRYQLKTPFLIPTKQSISACLRTIDPRIKVRK
ncbi:MAG: methyltransferase [Dehalococcoidia bacterium]|jgi:protein-S-isoprenylcysteine O-methyltransferase Ste14